MKKIMIIIFIAIVSLAWISFASRAIEQHKKISPEQIHRFERQEVVVEDFDAEEYILDIGGGGEGVIGQLKGKQVIAIDISKRELEDAPPGPLKLVMDAREMKFIDNSFNTATIFFTFMYINSSDHQKVLEEVFRVLVPGGRVLIWDGIFPKRIDEKKDIAVFPLKVKLPGKEITTGYGVRWPEKEQGVLHYVELAKKVGFEVVAYREKDRWFFLELKKR